MSPVPDVFIALIDALDGFAAALESGRADQVLAAEEPLALAATRLRGADRTALATHPDLGRQIEHIHHRLARCRALGTTPGDLLALMAPATYGPRGLQPVRVAPPAALTSRV